jgi:hypothetical protein
VVTVLQPVPGHPGTVRDLADALTALGRRVAGTDRVLLGLRPGPAWEGQAAAAFADRVVEVSTVLDPVARRYAGAAVVLRRFADALEAAQAATQRASDERERAGAAIARLEVALEQALDAGAGRADPSVVRLVAAQRDEVGHRVAAEAAHRLAWAAYEEQDRHCAATLRQLATDRLVDPVAYRALAGVAEGASEVSTGLALLSIEAPPLAAVAGAVSLVGAAAEATALVGWGDGDWGDVLAHTVIGGVGIGGRALSLGARAEERVPGAGALTVRSRLATGLSGVARGAAGDLRGALRALGPESVAGTRAVALAETGAPRGADIAGRARALAARARATARAKADEAFLDDWRVITTKGAGAAAPGMAVAGAGLRLAHQAGSAAREVADVQERVDEVRRPRPPAGLSGTRSPASW